LSDDVKPKVKSFLQLYGFSITR